MRLTHMDHAHMHARVQHDLPAFTCTHTHTYTHTHAHIYTHTHTHTYAYARTHTHTHTYRIRRGEVRLERRLRPLCLFDGFLSGDVGSRK